MTETDWRPALSEEARAQQGLFLESMRANLAPYVPFDVMDAVALDIARNPHLNAFIRVLLAQARADGERVRKLHHVETVMTIWPGCGEDGDCSHEDDCPEDHPTKVCAACREQMEIAAGYWTERADAWGVVLWPCATARVLDGSS